MTESAGTAQGVVEAKLLGGVRGGKQRVKIKIGFAGGRGPENVFVGPSRQRVSCVNSTRIERIFVADGPAAGERYCVNAAGC